MSDPQRTIPVGPAAMLVKAPPAPGPILVHWARAGEADAARSNKVSTGETRIGFDDSTLARNRSQETGARLKSRRQVDARIVSLDPAQGPDGSGVTATRRPPSSARTGQ